MSKLSLKLVVVMFALVASLFIMALPASAHTNTVTAKARTLQTSCHKLLVQLHGTQSATSTCLDGRDTGKVDCGNRNALVIWADANQTGWSICFEGAGFANMTSYGVGFWWNWNDQASSYAAGCSSGTFYKDINGGGQQQNFNPYPEQNNFDGQSGRLPNDSLSSLQLNSNC